jgi:malic enzyme
MGTDRGTLDLATEGPAPRLVSLRGHALLADRLLNKDAAFVEDERAAFGLRGLLPPRVMSIDEQVQLELEHVRRKGDDLERYIGLAALQDRNETLFHRLLGDHLVELMPIVYTPTVGRACQEFSHILRRPRGVWLTPDDADRIPQLLRNAAAGDVRLIVVTDNERILGLGDQGAGGMGIPVGKLAIYSAAAGIHPASTLPVSLDVGTDDAGLLADPLYLGHRAHRLRGAEYERFIERFVDAVVRTFPRAIVQWEDFKGPNALEILGRFRHRLPSFNDDIQGTGATVLAGVLAASRALELPVERMRFMVVGAGAAGIGIARMLRQALDTAGGQTAKALVMVDRDGVVHRGRDLSREKAECAVDPALLPPALIAAGDRAELAEIVEAWRPHVLIGTTAVQGRFDESTIRALARVTPCPVVMALSNPISACEVLPADVMAWSDGRALIATGSPFDPVTVNGTSRMVGQGNNAFIFPGLGLGAIVAEAREVTDGMLMVAARALAEAVSSDRLRAGALYPPIDDLPALASSIAMAVVREARDAGFGRSLRDEDISDAIDAASWRPAYARYAPG